MRLYLIGTALVFVLIVVAHVARVYFEGSWLLREPHFMLLTVLAAVMAGWAVVLLRRLPR